AQIEDIFENTVTLPLPIISMSGLYYGDDKDEIDSDDYDWRNVGHGALILLLDGVTDTYWYNQITNVNNPKIYFSGKLGYAVSSSDQQTPPVELPSEIVRAATITASAFTGMFQRESISYDGTRNTVTDTRIPEEAMTLLKPFTKLVL
ncbi:MAG TPA: hypothetical protein VKP88_04520, partial [Candidatus Paceibacterota bacterium]|nr:hypothetical protein [Candidatus Paceibacterota bacterium]